MAQETPDFVPRLPRHEASQARVTKANVKLCGDPHEHEVNLINFSRQGAQFDFPQKLQAGQKFSLTVQDGTTEPALEFSGQVRWCTSQETTTWAVGCEWDAEVDWEDLGELFLRGVLAHGESTGT